MSYLALYRKYRSQNFDELVGQETVVKTLKNALSEGRIAHAYLFCGPRGTGKTSAARLFAKALNCKEGIGHQCNKCDNCVSISNGSNPDVVEIDAASNSGVDEVRNLIDKVKYGPINGRYKVYIIDEVHMMSNSAFNALLKTLEEPPSYVVFILCTTEPYKLLPTIISRCQRYDFNKIPNQDLEKLLARILKSEKISYDSDVLPSLVEIASGGARDALSILDQLIAYGGNHLTYKNIEAVFGLTSCDDKMLLLNRISEKNTYETLSLFDLFLSRNVDINRLNFELLNLLKDTLVFSKTKSENLLQYGDLKSVKEINNLFDNSELDKIINILLTCQNELKTASNPSFLFEVYLLKLLDVKKGEPEKKVVKDEKKDLENLNTPSTLKPVQFDDTSIEKSKELKSKEEKPIQFTSLLLQEGDSYKTNEDVLVKLMILGKKQERKNIQDKRGLIDNYLNDITYGPFAALLKDSQPFILTSKFLILSFDLKKPAQKANIKENQARLVELIKKIFNLDLFVYALNREETTSSYQHYLNLQQLNKLPKKDEIEDIVIQ